MNRVGPKSRGPSRSTWPPIIPARCRWRARSNLPGLRNEPAAVPKLSGRQKRQVQFAISAGGVSASAFSGQAYGGPGCALAGSGVGYAAPLDQRRLLDYADHALPGGGESAGASRRALALERVAELEPKLLRDLSGALRFRELAPACVGRSIDAGHAEVRDGDGWGEGKLADDDGFAARSGCPAGGVRCSPKRQVDDLLAPFVRARRGPNEQEAVDDFANRPRTLGRRHPAARCVRKCTITSAGVLQCDPVGQRDRAIRDPLLAAGRRCSHPGYRWRVREFAGRDAG